MLKRLICLLMCAVILPVSAAAAKEEVQENVPFNERIEKLAYLGVTFDEGITHDAVVTRAKFIRTLLDFVNVGVYSADCGFYDVDEDYPYSDEINTGANLGYMIGYPGGYYYPERNISVNDAVKAIVNSLGYEVLAKQNGGYPVGYISTGDSIGLLDGVTTGMKDLTYDTFSKLLENALECNIYEMTFENGNPSYGESEETDALWKFHRIIKVKAVVTANSITGLEEASEKTSDDRYAELDGEKVLTGSSNIANYLGYSVESYVYYDKDEDMGEVKFAVPSNKNTTVTVKAKNILGDTNEFSAYNFVYETETGKRKNVKITEETNIIYNGIAKPDYKKEDLIPEIGNVTLIDNDSDGDIECISIFKAEQIMIVDYSASNEDGIKIFDRKDNNNMYFYNEEYEHYKVYVNGEENTQKAITKDMVALIGTNGEHSITYAFSNIIEGKITSMGKDNNGSDTVIINGMEYVMAPGAESYSFKLNTSGKFWVDDEGYIYGFDKEADSGKKYAYFIKGYLDEEASPSYAAVKVLTSENRFVQITLEEYVKYNGARKENKDIMHFLKYNDNVGEDWEPQLIMYELSEEGTIKTLNTVEETETAGLKRAGTYYHGGKDTLPAQYQALAGTNTSGHMWLDKENNVYWGPTHAYAHYYSSWSNVWYNDENTVWFVVNETDPEKSYVISGWDVSEHNFAYVHELYNESEETNTVACVVWKKEGGSAELPEINKSNRPAIVKNVNSGLNEDDEPVKTLECVQGGSSVTILWNNDADQQVKDIFNSLKPGDIIYYTLDGQGKIDNILRTFNIERVGEYGEVNANKSEVHDGSYSTVHNEKRCVYVQLTRKLQNNFYEYKGNEDDNLGRIQKMWGGGGVYRMTVRGNKVSVETITYDDVTAGDDIYCLINGRTIRDMIVIDVK